MTTHIANGRRRQMMTLALSPLLSKVGLRGAGVSLLAAGAASVPRQAQAFPVVAALSLASTVCGMVASKKRGDGGMGAMLSATLEYQRVLSQQLTSIQTGLAEVLSKVNALKDELYLALDAKQLSILHAEIAGSIRQYSSIIAASGDFPGGYQAWSTSPRIVSRLEAVSQRLDNVFSLVEVLSDPITGLYLPAAMFTSLGVRSVLGESSSELKHEAQRYLDAMARIQDETVKGSAAAELKTRAAELVRIKNELTAEGFTFGDGLDPLNVTVGSVSVQEYRAASSSERQKCGPIKSKGGGKPSSDGGGGDNWFCETIKENVPEYRGAQEAYSISLAVTSVLVKASSKTLDSFGIWQYEPNMALTYSGVPVAGQPWHGANESTPAGRLASAKGSPYGVNAEQKATRIRAALAKYNEEAVYAAMNVSVLIALTDARRDTFAFFGMEQRA